MFKVGDKVICIENEGSRGTHVSVGAIGEVYEISGAYDRCSCKWISGVFEPEGTRQGPNGVYWWINHCNIKLYREPELWE